MGGRRVDRGVWIGQAAHVSLKRIGAFVIGEPVAKVLEEFRTENLRAPNERPFDFAARAEKYSAQHEADDALGVGFGIGERQGRAPRAADDHPFLDCVMLADGFDIGDEVLCRIRRAREMRVTASGAALIEEKCMMARGMENCAVAVLRAAAGSAVQKDSRDGAFEADFFDVNPMPVANA